MTGTIKLTYGGISIDVFQVLEYRTEVVRHENQYLYTRHTIRVRGYFHPAVTSYRGPAARGPLGPTPIVFDPNNPNQPATTHQALRYALSRPRQTLTFSVPDVSGPNKPDIVVLKSPLNNQGVDSLNGPTPLFLAVTEISGAKMWMVEFGVETHVHESYEQPQAPILLSNFWTMRQEIDNDLYTTQIAEGEAVFDLNQLAVQGKRADDYRQLVVYPVPPRFKRKEVQIQVSPTGESVRWRVVDREEPIQPYHQYVARVTGEQTLLTKSGAWSGWLDTVIGGALGMLGAKGHFPIVGLLTGAAERAEANTPVTVNKIHIEVYGTPDSNRNQLTQVLKKIWASRVSLFDPTAVSFSVAVTHDLMARRVSVESIHLSNTTVKDTLGVDALFSAWPQTDEVADVIKDYWTHPGTGPAQPQNENNSRTRTFVKALVTANLTPPGSVPVLPSQPNVNPQNKGS